MRSNVSLTTSACKRPGRFASCRIAVQAREFDLTLEYIMSYSSHLYYHTAAESYQNSINKTPQTSHTSSSEPQCTSQAYFSSLRRLRGRPSQPMHRRQVHRRLLRDTHLRRPHHLIFQPAHYRKLPGHVSWDLERCWRLER